MEPKNKTKNQKTLEGGGGYIFNKKNFKNYLKIKLQIAEDSKMVVVGVLLCSCSKRGKKNLTCKQIGKEGRLSEVLQSTHSLLIKLISPKKTYAHSEGYMPEKYIFYYSLIIFFFIVGIIWHMLNKIYCDLLTIRCTCIPQLPTPKL